MKSNELRIGNLYIDICGINNKWKRDSFQHYKDVGVPISRLKPVPLTESLLLKAGFKSQSMLIGNDVVLGFGIKISDNTAIIFNDGDLSLVDSDLDIILLEIDFKFFHQLQNLFHSLTGQELKC